MAYRYSLFVALIASVVSGCYLPTANRLCKDLRVAVVNCKDHPSVRNTFVSAFPIGTKIQDLRDSVNRIFIERDPLTHLGEEAGVIDLIAGYDVKGFAACKERITVRFALAGGVLTDIAVEGGQTCL